VRESLAAAIASHGPARAAAVVRQVAITAPDAAAEIALLAEIAADPDEPATRRAVALAAATGAIAIVDARAPDLLGDAIDDNAVIDAAIAAGVGHALTAAAAQLGDRVDPSSRRRLGRRLVAAGVGGTNVVELLAVAGDHEAAATAAAADLEARIAPRLRAGDVGGDVIVWAGILVDWHERYGEPVVGAMIESLRRDPATVSRVIAIVSRLRHVQRSAVERLVVRLRS
jgi:hypothetical protein